MKIYCRKDPKCLSSTKGIIELEFDLLNNSLSREEFSMMRGCQSNWECLDWECFQLDGYLEDSVQVDWSCFGKNLELDRSRNFYLIGKKWYLRNWSRWNTAKQIIVKKVKKSKIKEFATLHNSIGMGPSKWFLAITICSKDDMFPIHIGSTPEKWLLSKRKNLRLVKLKLVGNICPLKLLFDNVRSSNC